MAPLPSSLGVSPQELLILFAQGQSRPGLGHTNEKTMKTKTKISGYILRSSAAALLFLCVVGLSSAITPKFPTSQNNIAFGMNGHGSSPSDCTPNDYTITTGSGTIVPGTIDSGNHTDDGITFIALPFPVTFYEQTFFSVGISSNGNLQFTGVSDSDFFNECPLPTGRVIDLIAPYWDDLHDDDTANGQGVFTSVSGTTPNRIFNIEFRENFFAANGPPLLDFEVRLHEDTPNFEIIYGALNGNPGDSATVGAQRDTGSHFTQFECDTGGLVDGLQLNFVYASGCASPTPTPTPTASLAPCDNYVTTTDTGSIVPGTTDVGNHCDDCATPIAFPFPITLYGYTFTTANVSANGALYLTGTSEPTNGCLSLPDPGFGRAIFPFQGGLLTDNPEPGCAGYPGGTCGIFTSVTGTALSRQFNIEWRAVLANDPTSPANFEVVFFENVPSFFDIIYGVIGDNGSSATSGVQASGAGPATTFSCGTSTLTNSLKVTYSCPAVSPTPTATATFTPTPTPTPTPCTLAAPKALNATNITFSSLTANWKSVSGATGYRLDVATTNNFTTYVPGYQNLDVGNTISFPVIGLSAGTHYYYRLRAHNGCATSGNSNVIDAQTAPCTPPAPNAQPETDVTFSSFTAHWSSVSGAIDYRLDVSTSNTFTTYVLGYQDLDVGNTTSFPVTGLSANTNYYYRVRAYNGCATSRNSNVQSVQTLSCTSAAPNAQNATDVTVSSFTAHWSSISGAIDYRLDVSTSNTFTTYVTGYHDLNVGNMTSFPVTGLSANTNYYYRVRVYNGCATSPNSNVRSVKTKPH
jgi:hypothetical protein